MHSVKRKRTSTMSLYRIYCCFLFEETVHLNITLVTLQCQSQGDAANTSTDAPGDPAAQAAGDVRAGEE